MSDIAEINQINNKIHTIRGIQVMLDRDIAAFYEVKPIRLREQVKRNPKRFPEDFMFQLTDKEVDYMVSQNAIPSKKHLGGFNPYVFTEQGVAALSAVLTNDRAIEMNLLIMRAFVAMRKYLSVNAGVFQRLEKIEQKQIETDTKFEQIFDAIESKDIQPKQGVFFDGQVFDAHKFVADLIRSAKISIVLIDNYIDDTVLTLFAKRKADIKVLILTKTITKQMCLDSEKFNKQYPPLEIKQFKYSHDRFLIIDDSEIYHIGASLKDLGKKWFAFSKMDVGTVEMLTKLGL